MNMSLMICRLLLHFPCYMTVTLHMITYSQERFLSSPFQRGWRYDASRIFFLGILQRPWHLVNPRSSHPHPTSDPGFLDFHHLLDFLKPSALSRYWESQRFYSRARSNRIPSLRETHRFMCQRSKHVITCSVQLFGCQEFSKTTYGDLMHRTY